jgi:hypothetical protein
MATPNQTDQQLVKLSSLSQEAQDTANYYFGSGYRTEYITELQASELQKFAQRNYESRVLPRKIQAQQREATELEKTQMAEAKRTFAQQSKEDRKQFQESRKPTTTTQATQEVQIVGLKKIGGIEVPITTKGGSQLSSEQVILGVQAYKTVEEQNRELQKKAQQEQVFKTLDLIREEYQRQDKEKKVEQPVFISTKKETIVPRTTKTELNTQGSQVPQQYQRPTTQQVKDFNRPGTISEAEPRGIQTLRLPTFKEFIYTPTLLDYSQEQLGKISYTLSGVVSQEELKAETGKDILTPVKGSLALGGLFLTSRAKGLLGLAKAPFDFIKSPTAFVENIARTPDYIKETVTNPDGSLSISGAVQIAGEFKGGSDAIKISQYTFQSAIYKDKIQVADISADVTSQSKYVKGELVQDISTAKQSGLVKVSKENIITGNVKSQSFVYNIDYSVSTSPLSAGINYGVGTGRLIVSKVTPGRLVDNQFIAPTLKKVIQEDFISETGIVKVSDKSSKFRSDVQYPKGIIRTAGIIKQQGTGATVVSATEIKGKLGAVEVTQIKPVKSIRQITPIGKDFILLQKPSGYPKYSKTTISNIIKTNFGDIEQIQPGRQVKNIFEVEGTQIAEKGGIKLLSDADKITPGKAPVKQFLNEQQVQAVSVTTSPSQFQVSKVAIATVKAEPIVKTAVESVTKPTPTTSVPIVVSNKVKPQFQTEMGGLATTRSQSVFVEAEEYQPRRLIDINQGLKPVSFQEVKAIVNIKTLPKTEIGERVVPSTSSRSITLPRALTETKPVIETKITPKTQTQVKSIVETKTRTKSLTETKVLQRAIQRTTAITTLRVPTVTRTFLIPPTQSKSVFNNVGGFLTIIRKKGKFRRANIRPFKTEQDAVNFGRVSAGTSASATFFVESTTEKGTATFGSPGFAGDFYKKGKLFIEKRERRIKSEGELQEITFKGIASQRQGFAFKKIKNIFGG